MATLQRWMRTPLVASGNVPVDDSQTPNERAYEALMAERARRKRAGDQVGSLMRWQLTYNQAFKRTRDRLVGGVEAAQVEAKTAQAEARNCRVIGEAHKREAARLAANEAPLRAGYVEACAERDQLREQVAKGVAPVPDSSAAVESLRRSHQRAVADAETYRGQARWLIDELARIDEIVSSGERPRVVVKRIAKLRTNAR